jgi:N-acetylglucosaminyldiphosphoundecaprenol N-acetyl-beta-D-mannosaminyltransferase
MKNQLKVASVNVLGIRLFAGNIASAINHVLSNNDRSNKCISATGAHGLVTAKRDVLFRKILDSFYINLPDGMPGVWIGRLKGASNISRCYGPDFFKAMFVETSNLPLRHFLCGGKEGVAERLEIVCRKEFENNNISGVFCPPFLSIDDYDYKGIAQKINNSESDIVWIGLSSPKQEVFAFRLSQHTNVKFLVCVGAAFDFHIGNVRQAPPWMQKLALEWLFRLCVEPKRLWKRYVEIVPLFIFFNSAELFRKLFNKT